MPVKSVEEYLEKHPDWTSELTELRELLLSTELEETIKWGAPAYTINGKNVIGLVAFKNHIALWFHQGALLKENTFLLHNSQESQTKAMRQIRLEKGAELHPDILRNHILEAIQNQKEGKRIKPETKKTVEIPPELLTALEKDPAFKKAFEKLTPGKQREYANHISEAKREPTKQKRLEKIAPMILNGQGLYDKYKNC